MRTLVIPAISTLVIIANDHKDTAISKLVDRHGWDWYLSFKLVYITYKNEPVLRVQIMPAYKNENCEPMKAWVHENFSDSELYFYNNGLHGFKLSTDADIVKFMMIQP